MPLDPKHLFDALDSNQVDYVVVGGVAAIAHGFSTLTVDLDICYLRTPANLERLVRALAPLHPRLREVDANVPFKFDTTTLRNGLNFTFATDAGDLDLLGEVAGIGDYVQVRANAEEIKIYERPHAILSLDALIRAKKAAGRPKDLNALKELEMLLALKNRKSKI